VVRGIFGRSTGSKRACKLLENQATAGNRKGASIPKPDAFEGHNVGKHPSSAKWKAL
jgi:hypothetical protein